MGTTTKQKKRKEKVEIQKTLVETENSNFLRLPFVMSVVTPHRGKKDLFSPFVHVMVHIKPVPERSFSNQKNGRITMRETTTQYVREVRYENNNPMRQRQYLVEEPPTNAYNNNYTSEYSSVPLTDLRDAYTRYNESQLNSSIAENEYMPTNEYMTDERDERRSQYYSPNPDYSRPYESLSENMVSSRYQRGHSRKQRSPERRVHERRPMQRIQPNEYMTESRTSRLETPRDSSHPSDLMLSGFRHRSSAELQSELPRRELSELKNRSRVDHYMNRGAQKSPIGNRHSRHASERDENTRHRLERNTVDESYAISNSMRRSGGIPRYRNESKVSQNGQTKRRYRPGARALLNIRKLQKSTCHLIPKSSFQRVVREVAADLYGPTYRFTVGALSALQEISEAFLVRLFDDANTCAVHRKRVTLLPSDMQLVRRLQRW
ncbi:hypothetical protein RB195_017905 [Necator americanus]|uniref:Core Histone H2A/H2B/H3 domain-containing protein n=1 Tax=Necator americanus TaxID=51031 RepID=A0ABR1C7A2_NECAM